MQYLESDKKLGKVVPNIALMLERNTLRFSDRNVYCEKQNGKYMGTSWKSLFENIQNIAANLKDHGFGKGEKTVVYSPNRIEMLELELAVIFRRNQRSDLCLVQCRNCRTAYQTFGCKILSQLQEKCNSTGSILKFR